MIRPIRLFSRSVLRPLLDQFCAPSRLAARIASSSVLAALVLLLAAATPRLEAQAQTATQTTLTGVTGISAQETLTASVAAGSTAVYPGTITFYDGKTVLGTRQLVGSTQGASAQGTAVLRLILGQTTHTFSAVFSPKYPYAGSTSAVLSVTGNAASTTTTISASGSNPYTLQGVVSGVGPGSLANSIVFVDTGTNQQLASASPGSMTRNLAFPAAPSLTVGAAPQGVAVADMNGDGIADIVTTSSSGNTVTVLLGNGNGTFTPASTSPTGATPIAVVVGDFNNDGILDLAVANTADNTVTVLLGTGSGAFTAGSTTAAGNGLHDIKIGDFNQDGILDLAVVNSTDNTCEELLGNGDGTFTASGTQPTGQQPSGLAVADFNGDGIPDLAVINTADNTLTVLLGQGDGPPQAKGGPVPTLSAPTSIVIGDFNGDGIADLAVVSYSLQKLQVFLGQGNGTFTALASTPAGNSPSGLVVGDFNADGIPDLATADTLQNTVSVLLGNGDGTFVSGVVANTGAGPTALAAGDLNGDGVPDLAVTDPSTNSVTVLLTYVAQTATATATGVTVGPGTHTVDAQFTGSTDFLPSTSATVNLTGSLVATQLTLSESTYTGQQAALTATLGPQSAQGTPTNGESITFYFINAQGVTKKLGTDQLQSGVAKFYESNLPPGQDTVYASYPGDATFASSQSANLTFTIASFAPTTTVTKLAVKPGSPSTLSALVATGNGTPVSPGQVKFYNGTILLGSAQVVVAETPNTTIRQSIATLASVDISAGDTLSAVFVGTREYATSKSATYVVPPNNQGSGQVSISFGKVTNTPPNATPTPIAKFHSMASAAPAASTPSYTYTFTGTVTLPGATAPTGTVSFVDTSNNNTVLATAPLGPATFAFTSLNAPTPNVGRSPDAIATGDFNNDGIADLAIANLADNTLTILLGKGDGTFTQQASPSTGSGPVSVAVGDFNSDGFADLAVANASDNTVTVLLGTGTGTFTQAGLLSTGQQPSSVATTDLNGDGIADLAVTNSIDSSVTVLLGNGDGSFYLFGIQATGAAPSSVATGDFNGDGIADLVTANLSANTLTVLLGNGDGSFNAAASPAIAVGAVSVAVQDFNGDGIVDLVAVSSVDGTVTVLLGNGDGSFKPGSTTSTNSPAASITVGDLNQDGILDLAIANSGGNLVTVLLGKGDGTFTPGLTEVTGAGPSSLAVGDFNDDGLPDLAIANLSSNSVTISLTQATATSIAVSTGVPILGTGNHLITAQTNGTPTTPVNTSAPVSLVASPLATTLTLGSAANSSTFGQPVTLTATLSPASAQAHNANGETVTFYNNGASIGTGTLNSGIASLQLTSLSVATYSFTAAYGGDTNFTASNAAAFAYQVNAAVPAITFSTASSYSYGQSFQLAAKSNSPGTFTYSLVSGPAKVTSAGMVTVIGEGTVTLQANQAAVNGYSSGSQQTSFTASKAGSTTTLSAMIVKSGSGSAATLSVTVAPQYTGAPSGSVTFYDGKSQLATVALTGSTATYTTPQLVAGSQHTYSVTYAGDTNFTTSTSNTVPLVASSTSVSLQFLSTQLVYPLPPVFGVKITPVGSTAPTGTVTIYDGTKAVATYPVYAKLKGNVLGLVLPPLNVGSHSLMAVYSGDSNYAPGQSVPVTVTVSPGPVKLTLSCASVKLTLGQALSCTVYANEGLLPVTGTVAYIVTNGGSGSVTLSPRGQAIITYNPLVRGTLTLTATYNVQGNYQAAQPVSINFTVN